MTNEATDPHGDAGDPIHEAEGPGGRYCVWPGEQNHVYVSRHDPDTGEALGHVWNPKLVRELYFPPDKVHLARRMAERLAAGRPVHLSRVTRGLAAVATDAVRSSYPHAYGELATHLEASPDSERRRTGRWIRHILSDPDATVRTEYTRRPDDMSPPTFSSGITPHESGRYDHRVRVLHQGQVHTLSAPVREDAVAHAHIDGDPSLQPQNKAHLKAEVTRSIQRNRGLLVAPLTHEARALVAAHTGDGVSTPLLALTDMIQEGARGFGGRGEPEEIGRLAGHVLSHPDAVVTHEAGRKGGSFLTHQIVSNEVDGSHHEVHISTPERTIHVVAPADKPGRLSRGAASRLTPLEVAKLYAPGLDTTPSTLKPVPEASRATAAAYDAVRHDPGNPEVRAAYDALKREVAAQYEHVIKHGGMTFDWGKLGANEYPNSDALRADIARGHMHVSLTGEDGMPADHPLAEVHPETGLKYNDLFRAVHDYFGHGVHPHTFGPVGEMRAWHEHAKMFSPLARRALTTETHGQNSWVNYHSGHESLPLPERPFAEQKATLLPETHEPIRLARAPSNTFTSRYELHPESVEALYQHGTGAKPLTDAEVIGHLSNAVDPKHPMVQRLAGLTKAPKIDGMHLGTSPLHPLHRFALDHIADTSGGRWTERQAAYMASPASRASGPGYAIGDHQSAVAMLHHPASNSWFQVEVEHERLPGETGSARDLATRSHVKRATKLARVQAPKGGGISDNQYQPGGRFLAAPFARIRQVVPLLRQLRPKSQSLGA